MQSSDERSEAFQKIAIELKTLNPLNNKDMYFFIAAASDDGQNFVISMASSGDKYTLGKCLINMLESNETPNGVKQTIFNAVANALSG